MVGMRVALALGLCVVTAIVAFRMRPNSEWTALPPLGKGARVCMCLFYGSLPVIVLYPPAKYPYWIALPTVLGLAVLLLALDSTAFRRDVRK